MRAILLPLGLCVAAVATVGLGMLVLDKSPPPPPGAATGEVAGEDAPGAARAAAPVLRPYQTTLTLAEDLRDTLTAEPAATNREVWRVSAALESRARWTLKNLAEQEASPKVRALLVLAAGVHVPEDPLLLHFLRDREQVVRQATVLAVGHLAGGEEIRMLLGAVEIPLGRRASPDVRRMLERWRGNEKAEEVRVAIGSVLSSPR